MFNIGAEFSETRGIFRKTSEVLNSIGDILRMWAFLEERHDITCLYERRIKVLCT